MSNVTVSDLQSGFCTFAASTNNTFRFAANSMATEYEKLANTCRYGLWIKEVEIDVKYGMDVSTESPVSYGLKVLVEILKDVEFHRILSYFSALWLVLWVSGLYMDVNSLRDLYLGRSLNFGPTMLMIRFTLISMVMASTGILLHSVTNMMNVARRLFSSRYFFW